MINNRLTSCRECMLIPNLLEIIDCKIEEQTTRLFHNVHYLMKKSFDGCTVKDLLHYKRILLYKNSNPEYAIDFSIEKIASKIREKTLGVSNCSKKLSDTSNIFTTTTTTSITEGR